MQHPFKLPLKKALYFIARAILNRYEPEIIGITGSVGKTSTREAIYAAIAPHIATRRVSRNYNNEIGLPLTIIGQHAQGRSLISWLRVLTAALWLLIRRDPSYPKTLILEMGIDRPGDMKYLVSLAPCTIGVVTGIGSAHLEYFKTAERIAKEKSLLISHMGKNSWAILNADNVHAAEMQSLAKGRTIMYGITSPTADLVAREVKVSQSREGTVTGLSFKMSYAGATVPVLLPNILGRHMVYAALAGAAVGLAYGMNMVDIAENLKTFRPERGRMRIIDGIKHTTIIDDTYNASPESMAAALATVSSIQGNQTVYAILGDMLELGDYTEEAHTLVGAAVVESGVSTLITVGERAKTIAQAAVAAGLDENHAFSFADVGRAGRFLQDRLEEGDLVLVKGSRGMRMEKVVREVMAEPLRAGELLVKH